LGVSFDVPPDSDDARGRRPSRVTVVVDANDDVVDVDDDDDDDDGEAEDTGGATATPALSTVCSEFDNRPVFADLSPSAAVVLPLLLLAIVDDWSLGRSGDVAPCIAA
jgi:hypothetical protein